MACKTSGLPNQSAQILEPNPTTTASLTKAVVPTVTTRLEKSPLPIRPTGTPFPTSTPTPTAIATVDLLSGLSSIPWPISTPELQGMDSVTLLKMFDHIETYVSPKNGSRLKGRLHSSLVIRKGHLVLEAHFWPVGDRYRPHDMYSVTKSILAILIGIAIDQGFIEGVDDRVLDYFPNKAISNLTAAKQSITIEDVLTMRSGLAWEELTYPYWHSSNTFGKMIRSPDLLEFVLGRPVSDNPGETFNYNSGASHLLSAILVEATGMSTYAFAKQYLFDPMEIDVSVENWTRDPGDAEINTGGWGLKMNPIDMAKIGLLFLHNGTWHGAQILSPEWVRVATSSQTDTPYPTMDYGYQWWVEQSGIYAAFGYAGQAIVVVPELEMVVVFTAGLSETESLLPLVTDYIIPSVISDEALDENPRASADLKSVLDDVSFKTRAP